MLSVKILNTCIDEFNNINGKPIFFQSAWNSGVKNKPTIFRSDWNTTIINKPKFPIRL